MKNNSRIVLSWVMSTFSIFLLASCSTQKQINKQASRLLYNSDALKSAHVGISVYDDSLKTYLYNYQSDKFFIPASTAKLYTLFAGLTYLPDSLLAAKVMLDNGTIIVQSTGDPTFLHPDFAYQPLLTFLQNENIEVIRINTAFASESFGRGWAWDDFQETYMSERDPFPMYGNLATIRYQGDSLVSNPPSVAPFVSGKTTEGYPWKVTRTIGGHMYSIDTTKGTTANEKKVTMAMDKGLFATRYLTDTLHKTVLTEYNAMAPWQGLPIYSQPKDSLFRMMMHRSDNFFAEQTIMMASYQLLGKMDDVKMIDTLLHTTFTDAPQKPKWADGSGLSRYNLFSPKDMVWVLQKLKDSFGIERIKVILPTANEGTLKSMFIGNENRIFAKSGSLSNNYCLSGYIFTKHNKRLTFSIMINNYRADYTIVKKEIEQFLTGLIDGY